MSTVPNSAVTSVDGGVLEAIDHCYEVGWAADGLPVVPPERARVEAMLEPSGLAPDVVLNTHPTTGNTCTALSAAVNAVMAGCLPEYFPVLLAALEALDKPDYNFHAASASTGGSTPVLLVAGPVVEAIGMNSGAGTFAPGTRANATLGRALRLILMNVFEMIPGVSDQSTQGFPGKYSFCVAERADANPWEPLPAELGYGADASCVVTYAGSSFNNVENHGGAAPETILDCIADSMANLGCITVGQSMVVLSPEHAKIVAGSGWSKADVRSYLFMHARQSVEAMQACGKYVPREHEAQLNAGHTGAEGESYVHRGLSPDDIMLTVAGGLAGGHSAFITSWSRTRASLMQHAQVRT